MAEQVWRQIPLVAAEFSCRLQRQLEAQKLSSEAKIAGHNVVRTDKGAPASGTEQSFFFH
jgi:hypothetical protein